MIKLLARLGVSMVALGCVAANFAQTDDAKPKPLNVLFIISDDLRTEPGCYGGRAITPNIDALAKAGVRFDRAYCQFPLCNPSRSSLMTGRYPTTTGILGNRGFFGDAHPDFVSLPRYFKEHGYTTLRTGKIFHGGIDDTAAWTEGGEARGTGGEDVADSDAKSAGKQAQPESSQSPQAQSDAKKAASPGRAQLTKAQQSDRFIVLPGDGSNFGDSRTADRAVEYLRKSKAGGQPFFIGCGFSKPHSPPQAPQRFYDLYDVNEIELPVNFAPRPTVPEGFPRMAIRPRNADLFIGRDASPEEARQMVRAYLASTSFVDFNVGRVIAEVDKLGLRENTIIIFWGDHGYQLGERGKWSKAGSLFEQGDRVPFIVLAPGAKGDGQPCERVIECVDVYPTLCELCGLPKPDGMEGRSFAKLLDEPKAEWDHPAFTVWSEDGQTLHGVAVRTERWRYAEFGDNGKGGAMLFDENADPQELKNLADDPKHADIRAKLSPLVKEFALRTAPKP
jgi:arylsulfatase A-like enzyme